MMKTLRILCIPGILLACLSLPPAYGSAALPKLVILVDASQPAVTTAPPAPPDVSAQNPHPVPVAGLDIGSMVMDADIVVQLVMGFLVLCSVATWTILIEKSILLGRVSRRSTLFLTEFRRARNVEDAASRIAAAPESPISLMWRATKEEWDLFKEAHQTGAITAHQSDQLLQRMVVAADIVQEQQMQRLSAGMGILATIGATSPFIGLFGTVWGILKSFVGIAATRATSLSVVAPGIAEALLATAIGLIAAIPAVMIYNMFARKISGITGTLDNFRGVLSSVVSREMERIG